MTRDAEPDARARADRTAMRRCRAIPAARVAGSRLADRIIAFDPTAASCTPRPGLTLRDINRTFLPRGWFVPVTPGTSFVTLGGAVASDVHGKNHHSAGTFGRHVRRLRLRVGSGDIVETSPEIEPDLFDATVGGMGLTGHMLEVEVALRRVPSPWIAGETEYVPDLEAMLARLLEDGRTWPYTLAWMDAIGAGGRGRGVVYRGRWAEPPKRGRAAHLAARDRLPDGGADTGRCRRSACAGSTSWSLLRYGRRVTRAHHASADVLLSPRLAARLEQGLRPPRVHAVPVRAAASRRLAVYRKLFTTIAARGGTPYVVVIKDFGAEGRGRLSFPCPGITFSIDMPIDAQPDAGHRRRGQRHRRGRGRPRLSHQGRLHARDALPRHGSPDRRLQRHPAALGSARAGSAARSRCACSETRREEGRHRRRHQGHRTGGGAPARRARRSRGTARA